MYIPPIKLACPIKVFWLPNVEHDAHGTLWEFNRCGFGLITLPEVFTAFVGEAFGPLKRKGVQNWLDDIIIYTQQVEGQLNLLRQMLDKLSRAGLSVNFSKSSSDQEFVGMVMDRLQIRPRRSLRSTPLLCLLGPMR